MPDPNKHAHDRGWIESILRVIPGFKGYLEKGYRRESDRLQREWLASQLQRSKQGLNDYILALTNAVQLEQLPACEQLRSRLDRLIARLQGSISGYSGFFDFVQVDEEDLDDIYAHDHALIQQVGELAQDMESLPSNASPPGDVIPQLKRMVDEIEQKVNQREDMLRGLGEN